MEIAFEPGAAGSTLITFPCPHCKAEVHESAAGKVVTSRPVKVEPAFCVECGEGLRVISQGKEVVNVACTRCAWAGRIPPIVH